MPYARLQVHVSSEFGENKGKVEAESKIHADNSAFVMFSKIKGCLRPRLHQVEAPDWSNLNLPRQVPRLKGRFFFGCPFCPARSYLSLFFIFSVVSCHLGEGTKGSLRNS